MARAAVPGLQIPEVSFQARRGITRVHVIFLKRPKPVRKIACLAQLYPPAVQEDQCAVVPRVPNAAPERLRHGLKRLGLVPGIAGHGSEAPPRPEVVARALLRQALLREVREGDAHADDAPREVVVEGDALAHPPAVDRQQEPLPLLPHRLLVPLPRRRVRPRPRVLAARRRRLHHDGPLRRRQLLPDRRGVALHDPLHRAPPPPLGSGRAALPGLHAAVQQVVGREEDQRAPGRRPENRQQGGADGAEEGRALPGLEGALQLRRSGVRDGGEPEGAAADDVAGLQGAHHALAEAGPELPHRGGHGRQGAGHQQQAVQGGDQGSQGALCTHQPELQDSPLLEVGSRGV
mmetsp:Transcript_49206/g.142607  ORF Transcript_49206/g.142607 Transcript_49206/m.142607 type:complete len:348 (+) Transcript_49206:456-1499(+)